MNSVSIPFPFAHLVYTFSEDTVLSCRWSKEASPAHHSPLAKLLIEQTKAYLSDSRFRFNLPLIAPRTPFEAAYRELLERLPFGKTLTYGEAAKELNSHPRAVGQTSRRNPVLLVVPCHRIIGQKSLGGYCGSTSDSALAEKRWLLRHEHIPMESLFV